MSTKIPFSAYVHTATYPYETVDGYLGFEKRRYEHFDPISGERSKTFRYWDPETRKYQKPWGADGWLYRIPDLCVAVDNHAEVHWTEGEKDADAIVAAGEIATSHHQGACHVTREQAGWLYGAGRVILWVDRDPVHVEVGAYDAVLRYNLLLDVGVPADRIDFVWARTGKDAYDHLQKYGPDEAMPVSAHSVASLAHAYSPASRQKAGYGNDR